MIFGFGFFGAFTFANVVAAQDEELCWKFIAEPVGDWILLPKSPDVCFPFVVTTPP